MQYVVKYISKQLVKVSIKTIKKRNTLYKILKCDEKGKNIILKM